MLVRVAVRDEVTNAAFVGVNCRHVDDEPKAWEGIDGIRRMGHRHPTPPDPGYPRVSDLARAVQSAIEAI